MPQLTLGAQTPGSVSQGQAALTQQAGAAAPATYVAASIRMPNPITTAGSSTSCWYWRKPDPEGAQVDAQKELQRLKQNAALGESPSVGETPIIQPRKKGWFSGLFSGFQPTPATRRSPRGPSPGTAQPVQPADHA